MNECICFCYRIEGRYIPFLRVKALKYLATQSWIEIPQIQKVSRNISFLLSWRKISQS